MAVVVHLEPLIVPLTPGDHATIQVRVRNTGTVVDQFSLGVVGDAEDWSTIDPPTPSLFPGAEASAAITFSPPRSSAIPAGPMPFGVRVESKEDPAASRVEEGTLELAPFSEVSAELVPRTSRGSTGATHDLAVDNRGNVALDAALTAIDPDQLLAFDLQPPAVLAEPGAAMFAKIRVKPRQTFWRGPSVARPFQLQVGVPDGAPLTIDGTLLQTAILPPWTVRAAVIALMLLVAAIVLWAGVLRPAIESTAADRAEDVLAAAGITVPPSGGPTDGGASPSPSSSADTASPSASAGATTAPSMPPVAGGATLSDGRLLAGDTPLTPPDGTTLFITDLVFSNPTDSATGEIRLERADQTLLALRLENFRDLDFHFVTPIVVADGQSIALVCPTGCPGAAVYYSGYRR